MQNGLHVVGLHKHAHRSWHSADNAILQQQLSHPLVDSFLHRSPLVQTALQIADGHIVDAIGPKPFLEIHRIHVDDGLITHGDRAFGQLAGMVTADTQ